MSFEKKIKILLKWSITILLTTNIFDQANILHIIMSKSKYSWWMNNNYTKKLSIEKLSQTTYDFSNIWEMMTDC
jgi:hypothetical protein